MVDQRREVRNGSSCWRAESELRQADADGLELEALEGLPCGCVAAACARPWDVAVVSLKRRTHCTLAGHNGQVLRLGDTSSLTRKKTTNRFAPSGSAQPTPRNLRKIERSSLRPGNGYPHSKV